MDHKADVAAPLKGPLADYRAEGEGWALVTVALIGIALPLALAPFVFGATLPLLGTLLAITALSALANLFYMGQWCAQSSPPVGSDPAHVALRRAAERAARVVGVSEKDYRLWIHPDTTQASAFTMGLHRPWPVFVTQECLTRLGKDEDALTAILAHEFSHIRYRHTVVTLFLAAPALGTPWAWLTLPARAALAGAVQLQEVTADRGACLCSGPEAFIRALLTLAGAPLEQEAFPALLARWREEERRLGGAPMALAGGEAPAHGPEA